MVGKLSFEFVEFPYGFKHYLKTEEPIPEDGLEREKKRGDGSEGPLKPKRCSRCAFDNPANAKFCARCSLPLSARGAFELNWERRRNEEISARVVEELVRRVPDVIKQIIREGGARKEIAEVVGSWVCFSGKAK